MSITSTVVDRAESRFIEAAEVLRPFVGCFWIITAERGATIRVVPDGSTAISVQLQDDGSSGWVLRGPLVRPQERRFSSPATLIGVRLRPGVAYLVSGVAADAMLGRRVRLRGRAFDALASDGSRCTAAPGLHPGARHALEQVSRLVSPHVPVVAGSARLPGREDWRSSQRRFDLLLFWFRRYLMNQLIRRERARERATRAAVALETLARYGGQDGVSRREKDFALARRSLGEGGRERVGESEGRSPSGKTIERRAV